MTTKSRQRLSHLLAGGLLVIALPAMAAGAPGEAGEDAKVTDGGWELRFYAAAVDMDHSSAGLTRPAGTGFGYDTGTGGGLGVNAEYRFSKRLGLDLGLFSGGGVDIEAHTYRAGGTSWVTYDSLTFTPLTAGLDVHLTPDARVDLYVCPMVALVRYGSLTARSGNGGYSSEIDFDEDFGLGARLGLGVPFGEGRWSFQANVTYLDASLEGQGGDGIRIDSGYDSTLIGIGFGYRFARNRG